MSKKHDGFLKEMVEKCPLLYGDIVEGLPIDSTCMSWGFIIGSGRFELVRDISMKLEVILQGMSEDDRRSNRAFQVKEKFGGLRFHLHSGTEEMLDLIDEAESLSYKTCEICGSKGHLRNDLSWIATLCEKHYEERLQSIKGDE